MRNSAWSPTGGPGGYIGRLALFAVAVAGAACASGGSRVAMTETEAEARLAPYAGRWVLDESGSSPQISAPHPPREQASVVVSSQDRERVLRELEAEMQAAADRYNALTVLRQRPETLGLRADGTRLIYDPTPGQRIFLPVDGASIAEPGGREPIRTRIFWDGPGLGIEYAVGSEGEVRAVLEIVNGRLRMTRTIRIFGETVAPLVLWYDREAGGESGQ